jgi:hypothetical protein
LSYNSKSVLAHRISYTLYTGQINNGLIIRHTCKNKLCVNPEHLQTGTLKENSADRWRDGTMNNKLTAEQVISIRSSAKSLRELAKDFDVDYTTISKIKNRKIWTQI